MKNKYIIAITVITVCCIIIGTAVNIMGAGIFDRGGRKSESIEIGETIADGQTLEAFDSINIDADVLDLRIAKGDAYQVEYEYTKGLMPVCEVKNGTLYVKQTMKKRWSVFGISNNEATLRVTIPEGTVMGTVSIGIDVGNIELTGIEATKCGIDASVGNIEITACSFGSSDIDGDTGNIIVDDTALGNAVCGSDVGSIKLKGCTFGNLEIETDIGDTAVEAVQALDEYDLDLEAELGSVQVNGRNEGTHYSSRGSGSGRIEISTDMGNISVSDE